MKARSKNSENIKKVNDFAGFEALKKLEEPEVEYLHKGSLKNEPSRIWSYCNATTRFIFRRLDRVVDWQPSDNSYVEHRRADLLKKIGYTANKKHRNCDSDYLHLLSLVDLLWYFTRWVEPECNGNYSQINSAFFSRSDMQRVNAAVYANRSDLLAANDDAGSICWRPKYWADEIGVSSHQQMWAQELVAEASLKKKKPSKKQKLPAVTK